MGVNITTRTSPASSGQLTDTGKLFLVGALGAGPTSAPAVCHSIADFESAISGTRSTSTPAWDYLDTFYREGGNTAYVLDYASAGTAGLTAALALLTPDLGPGQVACVGEAGSAGVYAAIQGHCDANNRIGLLDVVSSDNTASLLAAKGALGQALTSKENVGVFGSWAQVPAPAGVVGGTARSVPASAVIAALCSRVDQAIGANGIANYNQPAGGRSFPLQYATGFVYDPVLASDQSTIKAAGVNFFHNALGVLENYGFLTPLYAGNSAIFGQTPFAQLNCSRARMWLKAKSAIVGEKYYMQDIDAEGKLASQLEADLSNLCYQLWRAGGLFGETAEEAFTVNAGSTVNTTATAATGSLNAVAEVRFSQYADSVNITLVSVPLAGSIA